MLSKSNEALEVVKWLICFYGAFQEADRGATMHKYDVVMGKQVKRDGNTGQNMRNLFSKGFEENKKDSLWNLL